MEWARDGFGYDADNGTFQSVDYDTDNGTFQHIGYDADNGYDRYIIGNDIGAFYEGFKNSC